jgi:FkbM family methyltransferase
MNVVKAGNDYGGYYVDLDSISNGDTILDLGVGEDYSFSEFLHLFRDIAVIAVDPTAKALRYNESKNLDYVTFINKAVHVLDNTDLVLYKNNNPNHVSDSINPHMRSVGSETYTVKTISLKGLIQKYQPSLVKLDIEGAEYDIYKDCLGVQQVCLETHDSMTSQESNRDAIMLDFFKSNNYQIIHSNGRNIHSFLLK